VPPARHTDAMVRQVEEALVEIGRCDKGDMVVIVAAVRRVHWAGPTPCGCIASVTPRPSGQVSDDGDRAVDLGCPGWDSNPHCMVFETMDSACWSTGALRPGRT
jgi:hypothetical protein